MIKKFFELTFIRFAMVGVVSTIIDLALLNIFYTRIGTSLLVATAIGFLAASVNGYLLNSKFVFQREHSYVGYLKFFLVTFIGLLLTELIVHILAPHMNFNIAKLIAVAIVFFWNYAFSKIWAFK